MGKEVTTSKQPYFALYLHFIGQMALLVVACVVATVMVYHYYYGENGYHVVKQLKVDVAQQKREYQAMQAQNRQLIADVHDLKTGLSATEEYARKELGFIKHGEVFVQFSTSPVLYSAIQNDIKEAEVLEELDPTVFEESNSITEEEAPLMPDEVQTPVD